MTPHARSSGYAAADPIRTERGSEYAAFAKVTAGLTAADETDRLQFAALARAVYDNQRLWSVLEDDLRLESNALPAALRAQLIGLAAFVRRHSAEVLAGRASKAALVDINTAIMRGLRGQAEAVA